MPVMHAVIQAEHEHDTQGLCMPMCMRNSYPRRRQWRHAMHALNLLRHVTRAQLRG